MAGYKSIALDDVTTTALDGPAINAALDNIALALDSPKSIALDGPATAALDSPATAALDDTLATALDSLKINALDGNIVTAALDYNNISFR